MLTAGGKRNPGCRRAERSQLVLVLQGFREKRSPIERHFATFVPRAATLQPGFATEFATIATSCARGCVGDPFGIGQISRGFRVAVSRYRAESEAFLAGFGGWWLAMRGVTCVRRASTGRVRTDSGLEGWYRRIFSRRRGILCGGGRSWGAFGKDAYTLLINTNVIVRVRGGCVKGNLGDVRFFLKGGETPGGSPVARWSVNRATSTIAVGIVSLGAVAGASTEFLPTFSVYRIYCENLIKGGLIVHPIWRSSISVCSGVICDGIA